MEVFILVFILVVVVLPIWEVIDAATKPDDDWTRAGQNRIPWVALQLLLGFIGAAIYFLAIRPKLKVDHPV